MNKNKKTVAVLLAAYNGYCFIEEQISSILKQASVTVHIFISVDLSSDKTLELCKGLVQEYSNISLLTYGERFGGAGKNFYRLISEVDVNEFDYVALSDQDDIWLDTKLVKAIKCIEGGDFDAYSSDVMAFWESGKKRLVKKSYPQTEYDFFFESAGPGCTYVFTTIALQKFKTFASEHYDDIKQVELHDWMLYAFFRARGMKWYIDDRYFMLYRQHASNQFGSNTGLGSLVKRFSMLKSKWYRSEVEKIYALVGTNNRHFLLGKRFLVFNFYKLRRRLRDKFILGLFIITGIF